MGKKTVALKPGDIVAIPRKTGGYYLVLHLATNRFGEAFGLFQGHHESPDTGAEWEPVALPNHV
ncbi:MAG: hypothetical protein K8T89_09795, partial [Planctomycetes bacterium]|nr:hypothetical protein [Planctomycetota bacterium]